MATSGSLLVLGEPTSPGFALTDLLGGEALSAVLAFMALPADRLEVGGSQKRSGARCAGSMWSSCSAADCEARFAAGTAQRIVSEDRGAPPLTPATPAPAPGSRRLLTFVAISYAFRIVLLTSVRALSGLGKTAARHFRGPPGGTGEYRRARTAALVAPRFTSPAPAVRP